MNNPLNLYPHNEKIYQKVKEAYEKGETTVGIIQATGTGKTFNALQLALDHPNEKIVWFVPSVAIIEHIEKVIEENPNVDRKRDFSHVTFKTYQSLVNASQKELEEMECTFLILDELHHLGAPVWGSRINSILNSHPNILVFGMSAYFVRDRGTSYERDMINPQTNEIFSNKIVSHYDLVDAIIAGILPIPIYRACYTDFELMLKDIEKKEQKLSKEDKETLRKIKARVGSCPKSVDLMKQYLLPNGKYIFYCPINATSGINDMETIKNKTIEILKSFIPNDIISYETTSSLGNIGKKNRDCFYNNTDLNGKEIYDKLRIIFCINQYNEGVHADKINGTIHGRKTESDIVFFEQIGRALKVGEKYPEQLKILESYPEEKIDKELKAKNIEIKREMTKTEKINLLLSPVIIDLVNHVEFIRELETQVKDRIREKQNRKMPLTKREQDLLTTNFDIIMENEDIFQLLCDMKERLTLTWEEWYELAKNYYEAYGDLEVPTNFKTKNGVDREESGYALGMWITRQRSDYSKLSEERKQKLMELDMRFDRKITILPWEEWYELAKNYYKAYGNLEVPDSFKTKNGVDREESGYALGKWIMNQRRKSNELSEERKQKLMELDMRFDRKKIDLPWEEWYELARNYYAAYGDLEVPTSFKTKNGVDMDESGYALGIWIITQRRNSNLLEERKQKLLELDMRFDRKTKSLPWEKWYERAKKYYEAYGDLEVPQSFITENGVDKEESGYALGIWIITQRNNSNLSEERKQQLDLIGMRWTTRKNIKAIKELCELHQLDYVKNPRLLKLSYVELEAKIEYIIQNNLLLETEEQLNEIFFMSEENLFQKYQITLEELVDAYTNNEKRKR